MSRETGIEWTGATWTVVQGCDYESPGCKHCYAVPMLWRLAQNPNPKISGPIQGLVQKTSNGALAWTGKVICREDRLGWPLEWKKPLEIFLPSHGDPFHESVPDEFLDRIMAVIALCPRHDVQLLTKRSARMKSYLSAIGNGDEERWARALQFFAGKVGALDLGEALEFLTRRGPLRNLWVGVSVEDQRRANLRVPDLMATPAAIRFLSCEPLLGFLDLSEAWHGETALDPECWGHCAWCDHGYPPLHNCQRGLGDTERARSGLDWVICGGESQDGARPLHPDWARSLRDQCVQAGVPFFFKQWGDWEPVEDYASEQMESDEIEGKYEHFDGQSFRRNGKKAAGRLIDGRTWDEKPAHGVRAAHLGLLL